MFLGKVEGGRTEFLVSCFLRSDRATSSPLVAKHGVVNKRSSLRNCQKKPDKISMCANIFLCQNKPHKIVFTIDESHSGHEDGIILKVFITLHGKHNLGCSEAVTVYCPFQFGVSWLRTSHIISQAEIQVSLVRFLGFCVLFCWFFCFVSICFGCLSILSMP